MITEQNILDLVEDLKQVYNVIGEKMSPDNVEYAEGILKRNIGVLKEKLQEMINGRI